MELTLSHGKRISHNHGSWSYVKGWFSPTSYRWEYLWWQEGYGKMRDIKLHVYDDHEAGHSGISGVYVWKVNYGQRVLSINWKKVCQEWKGRKWYALNKSNFNKV